MGLVVGGGGWDSFDFHFLKATDLDSVCVCVDFTALSYDSHLSRCIPFVFRTSLWVCMFAVCLYVLCPFLLSLHLVISVACFFQSALEVLNSHESIFLNFPRCMFSIQVLCDLLSSPKECVSQKCWSRGCLDSLWAACG